MTNDVGAKLSGSTRRQWIVAATSALCLPTSWAGGPNAPALMLANVYRSGVDLTAYWVSEKFDGLRGYWSGEKLLTRGGTEIHAPSWFTAHWPATAMDGELWAGRGGFELAVGTVRSEMPDDEAWRRMRFMVFDLPQHPGTFDERLPALLSTVNALQLPWVRAVQQERATSAAALRTRLEQIVRQGGEGLMLHRGSSHYAGTRSDDLLKVKLHEDADAQVIRYLPGKGKYQGLVGAMVVRTPEGKLFSLGSGLSDAVRRAPPAVGAWVTYRYRGTHDSGLPRFATFLRLRADAALNGLPAAPSGESH